MLLCIDVWYLVCRHCQNTGVCGFNTMFVNTAYTGVCGSYNTLWGVKTLHKVASHPCQEGRPIVWAFRLGGLAVHQSVWGGSFVNFLGLVKLQGWLQARRTANPQFLKLKGAQQPSNSYISMGTKLHPPYPNQTACLIILIQKVSSMLEEHGPVQFLWHWQVQFLAKLAHTSK